MANKPDKFDLKFWLAVDVENKYLFNSFPHVEKDDTRSSDTPLPTDVLLKLMAPLFQQGRNVTCDNYFTSFGLALKLVEKKCCLVGNCARIEKKSRRNAKRKRNCMKPKCLDMMAKRQSHSHPTSAKQQKRENFDQLAPGYPCFKRQKPKSET